MYDRYGLVVGSMAGMAIVVFGESRTCIYTSVCVHIMHPVCHLLFRLGINLGSC